MAEASSDDSLSWQTTAGEQFSNLKEKMIAATGYTAMALLLTKEEFAAIGNV